MVCDLGFLLCRVEPPDRRIEGNGEEQPEQVGHEQQPSGPADVVECDRGHQDDDPKDDDLEHGPVDQAEPEEQNGPGEIQGELSREARQRNGAVRESGPSPDQPGGHAHEEEK